MHAESLAMSHLSCLGYFQSACPYCRQYLEYILTPPFPLAIPGSVVSKLGLRSTPMSYHPPATLCVRLQLHVTLPLYHAFRLQYHIMREMNIFGKATKLEQPLIN